MKTLVLGGTGATGRLLVRQLVDRGHEVVAIVRSTERLYSLVSERSNLKPIEASLLDLSPDEVRDVVKGCDAAASCLGHNLSLKGLYGRPRKLVTEAVVRVCDAIRYHQPERPVRFVLMNTTGNRNRDLEEHRSFGEAVVVGLLRLLLPPHPDNEAAAEYLRAVIGRDDPYIEWAAVRPDGLVDEEEVSKYSIHASPIRSPIFNAGQTSRINVAHFMAELMTADAPWDAWKGSMPVIYNDAGDLDVR